MLDCPPGFGRVPCLHDQSGTCKVAEPTNPPMMKVDEASVWIITAKSEYSARGCWLLRSGFESPRFRWIDQRKSGHFYVLLDRPDGTILISEDLIVYLVLGYIMSSRLVAWFHHYISAS